MPMTQSLSNGLEYASGAKAALNHLVTIEFVVWCDILCGALTEIAFAELVGQNSDSTFRDVDCMWHVREGCLQM